MIIQTKRLILRPWSEEDFEPFRALNKDPRVMEHYPATLSKEESDQMANKVKEIIEEKGWGLWAVAVKDIADFIGYIGLNAIDSVYPFAPAVEIGWRLNFDHWGKGYATEGAKASLKYGFKTLSLDEIISFTSIQNTRSRRVMERIGMHHDPKGDFNHPKLPEGHPLQKHVLYQLKKEKYQ